MSPPAMNATKRKFNALLQGLADPPFTPYSHSPDASLAPDMNSSSDVCRGAAAGATNHDALLQKRRRLGLPESTAPKNFSAPSVASALTSLASSIRKPNSHGQSSFSSSAAAAVTRSSRRDALVKYCPGDRDQLLGRLATFQELTDWTPKPDDINEMQWAKRGWICQAKETVRCILCHKELVVKLSRRQEDDEQSPTLTPSEIGSPSPSRVSRAEQQQLIDDLENALVEKYGQFIVSAHQQDCLWRKRGCDDSLLRLSFSNTRATLAALRLRYDELCARASFLPYEFNVRAPEDVDLDQVLSLLPPGFFKDLGPSVGPHATPATKPVNRPALILALMGWQGLSNSRIGAVPNSASCHTCHRRLGLWMFKSKEVDDGNVLVSAPMDHLDPLREHRFFCPWKNAVAQSRGAVGGPGSSAPAMPAWVMLLQTLRNEASLRSIYESRSKTSHKSARSSVEPGNSAAPSQSTHPATPAAGAATAASQGPEDDEADEMAREAKDKERWARLRKVKSLFDTKGARILRRSISSRPGTGHSNKS